MHYNVDFILHIFSMNAKSLNSSCPKVLEDFAWGFTGFEILIHRVSKLSSWVKIQMFSEI
jgi:hypothetical protein